MTTPLRQCNLGVFYKDAKRYDKALDWYHRGARQGCPTCEHNIGHIYSDGHAEYNLGICYENGNGVKRNVPEAVKWFTKAAEKGHPRAAENARRLIDAMA